MNGDFRRADLTNATLSNTDLWQADLRLADLRSANLWQVDLSRADLRGALNLDQTINPAGRFGSEQPARTAA